MLPIFGIQLYSNLIIYTCDESSIFSLERKRAKWVENFKSVEDLKKYGGFENWILWEIGRIIKSIAPTMYTIEDIKMAIAPAMFGGSEKNVQGKHKDFVETFMCCYVIGDCNISNCKIC